MRGPTKAQERVLLFIADSIETGLPPTLREITKHMGAVSTNSGASFIRALERKGFVTRRAANISRNLVLTEAGRKLAYLLRRAA